MWFCYPDDGGLLDGTRDTFGGIVPPSRLILCYKYGRRNPNIVKQYFTKLIPATACPDTKTLQSASIFSPAWESIFFCSSLSERADRGCWVSCNQHGNKSSSLMNNRRWKTYLILTSGDIADSLDSPGRLSVYQFSLPKADSDSMSSSDSLVQSKSKDKCFLLCQEQKEWKCVSIQESISSAQSSFKFSSFWLKSSSFL